MSRTWSMLFVVLFASMSLIGSDAGAQAPAMPKAAEEAVKQAVKLAPLDLNGATADQLKALPGVGESYAKKIVDGRPFKQVDELVSKKIVPQPVYDGIKDLVVVRP